MKRRNAECGKLRRPVKRNKITEGIYGSTFLYVKFLLVWSLVLMADFIVEFRFEYLWPFWLLLRSVYDSFKYQGLAFSVFFVCIAVTSDVVCYLFIPVQWLFFAASTYVWVQYVWHTERGICLPTVSLWLLFVYIEASVRLRDFKTMPIHLDLCRPFAAHCIGYPVVTLGFGFKSYISYRLRLRKQKDIQKENDFYVQLLQQALPQEDIHNNDRHKVVPPKSSPEETLSNGSVPAADSPTAASSKPSSQQSNGTAHTTAAAGGGHTPSSGKKTSSKLNSSSSDNSTSLADTHHSKDLKKQNNNSSPGAIEDYMDSHLSRPLRTNVNDFESEEHMVNEANKSYHKANGIAPSSTAAAAVSSSSSRKLNKDSAQNNASNNTSSSGSSKRGKANNTTHHNSFNNNKDDTITRLESDMKRLKADLQSSRNTEQELRSQLNSVHQEKKSNRDELYQLRQDNESLQTKLHNLVTQRQQDKSSLASLEKRLNEERKQRMSAEQQVVSSDKKKKAAEESSAACKAAAAARNSECTDMCKVRRRETDNDLKQLVRELKLREDQIRQLERETQTLRQYKDTQNETDVLMSALAAMQDKTAHLENSLSAETRLKLDLFSALGEAKRQIEIHQGLLLQKEAQVSNLESKIAEVMAVLPASSSFTPPVSSTNSPHFSATFTSPTPPPPPAQMMEEVPRPPSSPAAVLVTGSSLNPNASDYTPKQ